MSRRTLPNPAGWCWVFGAALVVTAARWREIAQHGGEIPFLDQWLVEARQILLPWLDGKLTPADFLQPHHEHIPAWSRLLVWLEAVIGGSWDGQVQATLNATLMGGFAGLLAAGLRRALPLVPALALTALTVVLVSLPHSWENTVWGFQSHIPLALLFVTVHVHGSFARAPGSASWWLAQAAGLAALFTLGSMGAAPFAVLLVLCWTSPGDRSRLFAAVGLATVGAALFLASRAVQPHAGAYTLGAADPRQFLAALLRQLGWPSAWPGAALLLHAPVLGLAARIRGKPDTTALDRTALALALWAAAQAVAFAYARGSYGGFVSRYGDLLALGVIANGVALWRLGATGPAASRLLVAVLALGWGGAVAQGLTEINVQGHTGYFHDHSARWAAARREAVRQYLATGRLDALAGAEVRTILYPAPAEVAEVLQQPGVVAMLPASVRPGTARTRGDSLADILRELRGWAGGLAIGGGVLLLAGVFLTARAGGPRVPDAPLPPPAWGLAGSAAGLLALGAGALLFLWPRPFEFRLERRWAPFLRPPGTLTGMSFHIVTDTTYPRDNLEGGAALWPEKFRNIFSGTHIDGPAFTGAAEGTPFRLDSPWYVVPYAGYPLSPGNGLRLRIANAMGDTLEELQCPGPNPGPGPADIGFWAIDARPYAGRTARLVLYDGRTDAEGWVAVAPPQPSKDGEPAAAALREGWAAEGTLAGLQSLRVICAAAALLAAGAGLGRWRARRRGPTEPAGR